MNATTVTLSLPTELVREIERIAAERNVPLDDLVASTLSGLLQTEERYEIARSHHLAALAQKFNLGTNGKRTWSRDELHERP